MRKKQQELCWSSMSVFMRAHPLASQTWPRYSRMLSISAGDRVIHRWIRWKSKSPGVDLNLISDEAPLWLPTEAVESSPRVWLPCQRNFRMCALLSGGFPVKTSYDNESDKQNIWSRQHFSCTTVSGKRKMEVISFMFPFCWNSGALGLTGQQTIDVDQKKKMKEKWDFGKALQPVEFPVFL